MNWLQLLTGRPKPIIGMVHLPALPGTPLYDAAGGMQAIRDWVRRDLDALQSGGIDAVMFCNENDRPDRLDADFASVAAISDVVASFRDELVVPFGSMYFGIRKPRSPSLRPPALHSAARSSQALLPAISVCGLVRPGIPPVIAARSAPNRSDDFQHQRRVRRPHRPTPSTRSRTVGSLHHLRMQFAFRAVSPARLPQIPTSPWFPRRLRVAEYLY